MLAALIALDADAAVELRERHSPPPFALRVTRYAGLGNHVIHEPLPPPADRRARAILSVSDGRIICEIAIDPPSVMQGEQHLPIVWAAPPRHASTRFR